MLYSFDVFDTVITRKTATPEGIWKRMQAELLHGHRYEKIREYVRRNFYDLRIRTERLVRVDHCYNGIEDVTLSQIYEGLVKTGYIDREQSGQLEELEIRMEVENVLEISENVARIKELLRSGQKVIFISDMYLSEKTIRQMLIIVDPVLAELPLYVSGDYKKSKWTGSLYHLVRQMENTEYSDWLHTGDNGYSDVEVPARLGIKTDRYFYEGQRDAEQYVLTKEKSSVYAELAAGASRYVRAETKKTGAWTVGVTAGANILLPYVLWVLKEAQERGIKRLYFVARDGYILKKMADQIIRCMEYPLQTTYIYGSRKAWRLPGLSATNDNLVELISWSHPPKIDTLDRLGEALGITTSEILAFLPQGFERETVFSSYTLYVLMNLLNQNPAFKSCLFQKHKAERMLVKRYLSENVDIHDDYFAFVELAGGGYTQRCLADLLSELRREQWPDDRKEHAVKTFYYKMDRLNTWKECQPFVFFPDQNIKNLIIEMVCRACHGQTIEYEKKEGSVQPVFDKEGKQLLDYQYEEYISGILQYTEYVCEKNPQMLSLGQMEGLAVSSAYLSYLLDSADSEEFLYYAEMPNNLTGRSDKAEPFAPVLTNEQLEEIFYSRRFESREKLYNGTCFELSLGRCSKEQNRLIQYWRGKAEEENRIRIPDRTFADSFPVGILGRRIVLYGAGRYGNQLYDILNAHEDRQVVQWIDQNHKKMKSQKMRIEGMDALGHVEYDCILIGVVSKESADEIRTDLIRRGILPWRIYWLGKSEVSRYLVWNQQFRWI